MTLEQLREIALHAAKGTAPANYTSESVNAAFVDGLRELMGTYNQFMKNRYDIYDIIIQAADEVMPKKVISELGAFCEIQVVGEGQKAMFKRKLGRNRAKKFLTQVGLSGVYETFRLDADTFELGGHAVGGGATVDFVRMIDGAESLAECMDIITEGLTDAVYYEVHKALSAAYSAGAFPPANKATGNKFNADDMLAVVNVVKSYSESVAIFATPAFIAAMGPDAIVPPITGVAQGIYPIDDIDSIHRLGRIKIFRGTPIVEIPNSFVDETNTKTWIDDQYAYILPAGREKVVKVVLEGPTYIKDFENRDNSMEVYAWKKMGAAILTYHNWGIYQNTKLAGHNESPYGF